ncbi:GntR family transcriptional regulator [Traorella massiliensis]|uniref:GntR family transcriptional regulator n=1 Tax=Traorella massiliensis TaxID=1903263 RepID=UPI002356E0AC|nr:GntR family transcriptional regulator [Traorella massiliensis]
MAKSEQPLYLTVKEEILRIIKEEKLKPGDSLPTEAELEERFNVSRTTIRTAINELKNEGYVIKQQGSGTFVANNSYEECVAVLQSFAEDALKHGQEVESIVLGLELIIPNQELLQLLEIDEEVLLKLQRVRYIDQEPVNLTTSYLPKIVYEKLDWRHIDFEKSVLYEEMRTAGIDLEFGEEILEVSAADELQASLLKVEKGSPLFNNKRKVYNRTGQLVEYSTTFTRGDKYRGYVKLKKRIN